MHIEENILYRNKVEPISTMISPLNIYNDTEVVLNQEQEKQLEKERQQLKIFSELTSVKTILSVPDDSVRTISQIPKLIEQVKLDLKKHNIPEAILEYVYSWRDEYDRENVIEMLPNKLFPITSSLTLKNAKHSLIYDNIKTDRWSLIEKYEKKAIELKDCKDENFVKQTLAPFEKNIKAFDKKNIETINVINRNEEIFNQYVKIVGLKKEFSELENTEPLKSKFSKESVAKKVKP